MKIRISQTLVMNTFLVALLAAIWIWFIPCLIKNLEVEKTRTLIGVAFIMIGLVVVLTLILRYLIYFYTDGIHWFDDFEINLFQKKDKKKKF